ncbi:methyl-galactoside transport system substrate-binding protein [Succinivibrio dextrinosolvens DSM 3072]|uniref:D-galactose/methyl-galactoside binding periplasmic protein MglB n=1 Tax=Succinivibrio dextrinosolvens DSM 3072 TaxID=1123324 RepID=A0A1T4UXE5_9GAMM|nr:galactose ABC transporter substrate-binding protein [Succinivibrio dextrinosolvens]SKA57308.1 methyl-galactoside transport system substrate-binding protein [Succinivibrio dextrinosolvens DSM 3072]
MKFRLSHLGMLAFLLAGSPVTVNADEQKSLDVFYYALTDQYIASFKNDIDSLARKMNISLESFDANNDSGTQELQIANTLSNNKAKIVNLVRPEITESVIENCKKNNLRVIFFNRQPDIKLLDGYSKAWYVEGDSMLAGQMQAEMIISYIKANPQIDRNKDGRISTIILNGPEDHQATYLRTSAVTVKLFSEYNNIDITKLCGNFDSLKARGELENYVINNGIDKVELIISNNDAMALGALSVLNNEGFNTGNKKKNYIPVFGIDGVEPAIQAIKEGKLEGTLVNDTKEQARAILELAVAEEQDNHELGKKLNLKVWENGTVYIPYTKVINK